MSEQGRPLVAGLAGAAATIAVVTVASRVVGFGRTLAQAAAIGPTALGDAYNAANTLPNVLFEVAAGGALAGAVVPLLATALTRGMRADVDRIASALLGWMLAVLVPLAVVVALAARPLVGFFLDDPSPEQLDAAAGFLAVFAPQMPLYGLGVVLTGVLQAHHRFLWPAVAPLVSSLVVVGVYLSFGAMTPSADLAAVPGTALAWLAWGTTAGVAAMTVPLLWPVHRLGVRLRPALRFPEGIASRARPLAVAGVGALLAQQAAVAVALRQANAYGTDGTFTVFNFSQAVYLLPYAVLAVPVATTTFPRLAERAAHHDRIGFARLTSATTRVLLIVSAAGAATLLAVSPAVEQAFAALRPGADFSGMAVGLAWTAPGLLGFALILHLSRALYALDRGRAAVIATVTGWTTVIAVALVAVPLLTGGAPDRTATLQGLGLATSLGMTVGGAALLAAVVRTAGREAAAGVLRTAAVLLVAGAVAAVVGRRVADAVLSAAGTGLGGAVLAGVVGALGAVALVALAAAAADRDAVLAAVRSRRAGGSPSVDGSAATDGVPATASTEGDDG
ncbi:MAG TPA: lipid II flippase MurJ [Actinotalea sp.]